MAIFNSYVSLPEGTGVLVGESTDETPTYICWKENSVKTHGFPVDSPRLASDLTDLRHQDEQGRWNVFTTTGIESRKSFAGVMDWQGRKLTFWDMPCIQWWLVNPLAMEVLMIFMGKQNWICSFFEEFGVYPKLTDWPWK